MGQQKTIYHLELKKPLKFIFDGFFSLFNFSL